MTGKELAALRHSLGLSQSQLAEVMGYQAKTISDLERGAKKITNSFIKHVLLVQRMQEMRTIAEKSLTTP